MQEPARPKTDREPKSRHKIGFEESKISQVPVATPPPPPFDARHDRESQADPVLTVDDHRVLERKGLRLNE